MYQPSGFGRSNNSNTYNIPIRTIYGQETRRPYVSLSTKKSKKVIVKRPTVPFPKPELKHYKAHTKME